MTDALVEVLVRLEDQNALLNQQLGVAKYWCHSLRGAVLQVAKEAGPARCVQCPKTAGPLNELATLQVMQPQLHAVSQLPPPPRTPLSLPTQQ